MDAAEHLIDRIRLELAMNISKILSARIGPNVRLIALTLSHCYMPRKGNQCRFTATGLKTQLCSLLAVIRHCRRQEESRGGTGGERGGKEQGRRIARGRETISVLLAYE